MHIFKRLLENKSVRCYMALILVESRSEKSKPLRFSASIHEWSKYCFVGFPLQVLEFYLWFYLGSKILKQQFL